MATLPEVPGYAITTTGVLGDVRSVSDAITGYASAQLVASAFSATVKCQGTWDNATWTDLLIVNMSDGTTASSITATGAYRVDVGGVPRFRWNVTGFSSATAAYLYPTQREG